ncbi:hypothetical protein [Bradyrhizobium genosp. A]
MTDGDHYDRYYKRQSQEDPNQWVWLDDTGAGTATLSAGKR